MELETYQLTLETMESVESAATSGSTSNSSTGTKNLEGLLISSYCPAPSSSTSSATENCKVGGDYCGICQEEFMAGETYHTLPHTKRVKWKYFKWFVSWSFTLAAEARYLSQLSTASSYSDDHRYYCRNC